ncbi:MAG TPA: acyl carrier protein [Candidatus Acidoferrum sp.]|nr:acyl carrier protein [Candidatus Acidoferrum sp.]
MKRDDLRQLLLEELGNLAPEADLGAVPPDVDLREALDLDSMDFLNLVMALHKRLAIDIPERDYAELRTIDGAIEYLTARAKN